MLDRQRAQDRGPCLRVHAQIDILGRSSRGQSRAHRDDAEHRGEQEQHQPKGQDGGSGVHRRAPCWQPLDLESIPLRGFATSRTFWCQSGSMSLVPPAEASGSPATSPMVPLAVRCRIRAQESLGERPVRTTTPGRRGNQRARRVMSEQLRTHTRPSRAFRTMVPLVLLLETRPSDLHSGTRPRGSWRSPGTPRPEGNAPASRRLDTSPSLGRPSSRSRGEKPRPLRRQCQGRGVCSAD